MDMSRKYSLILDAKPPAQFQGLQKNKSDYVRVNESEILWGRPFGASLQVHQSGFCDGIHSLVAYSTLVCPTSEAQITITLRQYHKFHPSSNIGTCLVDCYTLRGIQSE